MKNFTLSLYAFHLCQTLDDPPDGESSDANKIWQSLRQLGKTHFPFKELQSLKLKKNSANEWLTKNQSAIEFSPISTEANFELGGNLQPFQLHDTYCADFTLYPKDIELESVPEHLKYFQPAILLSPVKLTANLGKVFWISGETNLLDTDCKTLAENYAHHLVLGTKFQAQLIEESKLFNSLFYVFCIIPERELITLLVSINNTQANSAELANKEYDTFRSLLWSYQKIKYVYQQAQDCYRKSRQTYSALEQKIQQFHPILNQSNHRLEKLDQLLQTIPKDLLEYSINLRDLQAHYTTIETNANNFKACLNLLPSNDQIKTWQKFATQTCPRYLTQIKTHINYLTPGKELFNELTNTIRATAEVEQAKSDRTLQNTIAIVGVGIGAAGVAATASPYLIVAKPEQPITLIPIRTQPSLGLNPPHHLTLSFLFSLGVGLLGVAIAARATRYIQKKPQSAIANTTRLILGSSPTPPVQLPQQQSEETPN